MYRRFMNLRCVLLFALLSATAPASADKTAQITGAVEVDRGEVLGFKVKARDLDRRITYTVFTRDGRYRIPDLKPGRYEIWVAEERQFDGPTHELRLDAGDSTRRDFQLKARPGFDPAEQFRPRDPHIWEIDWDLPLVGYDELYPPGPGRDALETHCYPCHSTTWHHLGRNREGWKASVDRMTSPRHGAVPIYTAMPEATKALILDYLAANFGPDRAMKDLRLDELRVDEDEVADAVYIEYELPQPEDGRRRMHDPYVAPNGQIWFGDTGSKSVFELDPDADDFDERIRREFKSPNPKAFVHGITVDRKGLVYYGDIVGGYIGELDPDTGEFILHETINNASVLQVVVDSQDNIVFNIPHGDAVGRIDAETRDVDLWHIPTPDSNLYGLVVDHDDRFWSAAIAKHLILAFDPKTETFTEYRTPTQPSAPRRLGVDQYNKVWWAEYVGGNLGFLDPDTGEMKEYPFPLQYTTGYDALPVGDDIWITEATYQTLVRFNQKTRKFTYYPLPVIQPSLNPGVPKLEVADDGTIWFAYRGLKNNPAVAFKPTGNRD